MPQTPRSVLTSPSRVSTHKGPSYPAISAPTITFWSGLTAFAPVVCRTVGMRREEGMRSLEGLLSTHCPSADAADDREHAQFAGEPPVAVEELAGHDG